jgi:DNA (cytosine-5)-methyltransferase 1
MRRLAQTQHDGEQRSGTDGHVNGFWRDADWVLRKRWNREGWNWCPTQPGVFPLATGVANRVLKLRGYGDAIVPQVAKAFIESAAEVIGDAGTRKD